VVAVARHRGELVAGPIRDLHALALGQAQEALKGTDTDAIKAAMEKLATESQKLGAALYQQQGADGSAAGGATGGAAGGAGAQGAGNQAGSDDVVDAEIVDEDDKK